MGGWSSAVAGGPGGGEEEGGASRASADNGSLTTTTMQLIDNLSTTDYGWTVPLSQPVPVSSKDVVRLIKEHGVAEGVHAYHGKVAKSGGTTLPDQYVLTVVYKKKPTFHLVQKMATGVFAVNGKVSPGDERTLAEVRHSASRRWPSQHCVVAAPMCPPAALRHLTPLHPRRPWRASALRGRAGR